MLNRVWGWFDRLAGNVPEDVAPGALPMGPVSIAPGRADVEVGQKASARPLAAGSEPAALAQQVDTLSHLQAAVNAGIIGEARRSRITEGFNASKPVGDRYELSGRMAELRALASAVVDGANHAIIYGARGVGKTSLARVFGDLVDEAGCDVFYHSASGDAEFEAVVAPYVRFIEETAGRSQPMRSLVLQAPFSARDVADALASVRTRRIFLILDEFDRITNQRTRSELAALMKLLSDFRIPVQFVMVGISNDVDLLIAEHASLRRHMAAIRVGPIEPAAARALMAEGGRRAGLDYEPGVVDIIAAISIGSPYHVRTLAREAGLQAFEAGVETVDEAALWQGIDTAWRDWSGVSASAARRFTRLAASAALREPLVATALLAGTEYVFDAARLAEAIGDARVCSPSEIQSIVVAVVDGLGGELREVDGGLAFTDSLAPQYLLLAMVRHDRSAACADLACFASHLEAVTARVGGVS
ncbi:ATP-binding protein [Sphingomonas sp. 179-I 2A4 NHS]|uniref:ATP-binding protein n=1 Tax=unclassified Sphingomonas TaxID=196159 RepID=UPI00387A6FB5